MMSSSSGKSKRYIAHAFLIVAFSTRNRIPYSNIVIRNSHFAGNTIIITYTIDHGLNGDVREWLMGPDK